MARLSALLTTCISISLSLGAVIEPIKAPHVGQLHQVIARQDDPPVVVPAQTPETTAPTAPTVTTPPDIPAPGVAIAAVVPTASGQIGVNPPAAPKIELHTSFTDEPVTVTLKGATKPTIAPALVTATVAEGFLNIGLAPKLADKLLEIAKQVPPCGAPKAKRLPPVAVKVKGRQVDGVLCAFDGFVSRVAQELELVDWELLGAQLSERITSAMKFDGIPASIQLIASEGLKAALAALYKNQGLAVGGLIVGELLLALYETFHLNGISSFKGIAFDTHSVKPSQTEYKTDVKTCKQEEKDRPKCSAKECKGDDNDFCTTGDQSGCPCNTALPHEVALRRPGKYNTAYANMPPLFGKKNVVKPPTCDSGARFNYPLKDWKTMANAFSSGPAKDLSKEAITAYNSTYKFTFGWFPNGQKCATSSVNSMLNYMMDQPTLNCREFSVENTLFGSGKMETDCGTVKWSVKMNGDIVFVDPVINTGPKTGIEAPPQRFCYDPKTEPWTGQNVVKATLEAQAKKACKVFADKGDYVLNNPKEPVRMVPVPGMAGDRTDFIDGVLYGFRLQWNRYREGCTPEELAKTPGEIKQRILPVEGDGSCSALMMQAWEKCNAKYQGNMGGFYNVGCLEYSFRPSSPAGNLVTPAPLEGGDD